MSLAKREAIKEALKDMSISELLELIEISTVAVDIIVEQLRKHQMSQRKLGAFGVTRPLTQQDLMAMAIMSELQKKQQVVEEEEEEHVEPEQVKQKLKQYIRKISGSEG